MKRMQFMIFFAIVITIYALVNIYIFIRGLQAIPSGSLMHTWYIWSFWILAGSFIAGRFLERIYIGPITDIIIRIGSFWLAAMLFFFLLVVIFDLGRMINYFVQFLPAKGTAAYGQLKIWTLGSSLFVVVALILAGHINALHPKVRTVEITIDKPAAGMQRLEAVVMSDIHLGTIIDREHLDRIVEKVNNLKPDIILLPGDILDEDLEPVIRQNSGETLRQLSAPLGVYAVMGNHEYIGGGARAYEYLTNHGIKVLRDTSIYIKDHFILVGREDRNKGGFTGNGRKTLDELFQEVDFSYPVILMDHQPYYLEEAAEQGVDLQLSGHTHHGQIWPLNLITQSVYTISHGYGKVGNMQAYISNGVGTWGPPVRIGNRPEIVHLIIHFARKE